MSLRIGSVRLSSNVLLCPLAGYTDLPFRLMVRQLGGLGLAYTELVHPRGLQQKTARSVQIVATNAADEPLAVQLYGTDAHDLAEAARWAADRGSPIVDINMGCPVPKVAGKGGGSGILRHCPDAVRLAEIVVKGCPVPVTIKTRLGWEMGNLVAPRLARQLEEVGVAGLTIHGRFGEQRFSGLADWDAIGAVVSSVRIPVIGNGDVRSPQDAQRLLLQTGAAGVMIGRRALIDPWIFRDTTALLQDNVVMTPPDKLERVAFMIEHFRLMRELLGDRTAINQMRKRSSWYVKSLTPAPELRRQLPLLRDPAEFFTLMQDYAATLHDEPAVASP